MAEGEARERLKAVCDTVERGGPILAPFRADGSNNDLNAAYKQFAADLRLFLASPPPEENAGLRGALEAVKAFVLDPVRMTHWDQWRAYIAKGGKGSLPRDGFEAMLSWIEQECDAALNQEADNGRT